MKRPNLTKCTAAYREACSKRASVKDRTSEAFKIADQKAKEAFARLAACKHFWGILQ